MPKQLPDTHQASFSTETGQGPLAQGWAGKKVARIQSCFVARPFILKGTADSGQVVLIPIYSCGKRTPFK